MHVANCEYLLRSILSEMNADQSLFVVDLNERRSNSTNLVWLIPVRSFTGMDRNGPNYRNGLLELT